MSQTVVDHRRALHRIPELDIQLSETVAEEITLVAAKRVETPA